MTLPADRRGARRAALAVLHHRGEAVACGDDGIASFDRIRHQHHDGSVFLYAFDLIEFNGDDLRRDPLNVRKATLTSVLARAAPGLRLNEHAPFTSRLPVTTAVIQPTLVRLVGRWPTSVRPGR